MSGVSPGGRLVVTIGEEAGTERPLPGRTAEGALLVVDVQRSFADPAALASMGLGNDALERVESAVEATERLVSRARAAGMTVVWIELQQRAEAPWYASSWLHQRPMGQPGPCMSGTAGAEWYRVGPAAGDPRVPKRRYSGFVGTDLDAVLRSRGITWVVVSGLTTECCVESTARDAFQLDYRVIVAGDACAAYRPEDHQRSLELLALNFAIVTDVTSLESALSIEAGPLETAAATGR